MFKANKRKLFSIFEESDEAFNILATIWLEKSKEDSGLPSDRKYRSFYAARLKKIQEMHNLIWSALNKAQSHEPAKLVSLWSDFIKRSLYRASS
jgi:hypothetical protein